MLKSLLRSTIQYKHAKVRTQQVSPRIPPSSDSINEDTEKSSNITKEQTNNHIIETNNHINDDNNDSEMICELHLDLGMLCILANVPTWRKFFPYWQFSVIISLIILYVQTTLAISLWNDENDLASNLFVRSANNSKFFFERAICMLLVMAMMFTSVMNLFKKVNLLVFVLEKKMDFFLLTAVVAHVLEFISIALTVMVSYVVIMASDDSEGAIGIIMNFTALLVVAEIDDVVTPFVCDVIGCFSGDLHLGYKVNSFLESYTFTPTEAEKMKQSYRTQTILVKFGMAVCSVITIIGWLSLLTHFDMCNSTQGDMEAQNEHYIMSFYPEVCGNSTMYCAYNAVEKWVLFEDTNCAIEYVEEAALYFTRRNISSP